MPGQPATYSQNCHSAHPESIRSARLGIIMGTPAWRDPEGVVWISHAQGRLIDALQSYIPDTRIALPMLRHRIANQRYAIQQPPHAFVDLPPLANTVKAQFRYLSTRKIIKAFASSVDALFIRVPFQLPATLRNLRCPKLIHVVGNPRSIIAVSNDYRGLLRFAAQQFAAYTERSTRRLVAEPLTRTATNGEELWDILQCNDGCVTVSSCLPAREIQPRQDNTLNSLPRLLFVGYLRPEKGINTLLAAFEILRQQRPLQLTLIGGSDRPSYAEAEMLQKVKQSRFSKDITVCGMMDFGPELFNAYRTHDIYVLPSLSEGTPRTLVEARAFGCAVVASRVGGVPSSVEDGRDGLLVEPGNTHALVKAINNLLDDNALRSDIIARGIERSARFTLEAFAGQLVSELDLVYRSGLHRRDNLKSSPA